MDYEKAYKEALERARKIHNEIVNNEVIGFPGQITDIFPELRESEDERMVEMAIKAVLSPEAQSCIRSWGVNPDDVIAWLEKQKEQKPAEKQDYSGLNDLERAIHRGFLCAGVENVPVTIIKDTAAECMGFLALIEPKPAWSEEDERRIDAICELLENTSAIHPNYSRRKLIIWLKSLRPSWKPNEEQMDALQHAIDACESEWAYQDDELRSLLNDIKKL